MDFSDIKGAGKIIITIRPVKMEGLWKIYPSIPSRLKIVLENGEVKRIN